MLVQMLGHGIASGANEMSSVLVLENRVLCIEQSFDLTNGHADVDPVFGSAVAHAVGVDAVLQQPLVHEARRIIVGCDERVHFSRGEMLTVATMIGIRNYCLSA